MLITGNLRLLNICSAQIAGLLTIQENTVKVNQNVKLVKKKSGHNPGDRKCDSYEVQQNIIAFNGEDNVLSNFFQCEMTLYGVTHKSAEHAFQFAKAMRCGDQNAAAQIQSTTDALSAKRIGDKVQNK